MPPRITKADQPETALSRRERQIMDILYQHGKASAQGNAAGQRLLGNFPQAFSHVSLINTAHNLSHEKKPAEKRGGVQATRGE